MPALAAIPWLVPLISGISAAASLGYTGYELANQPGGTGNSTAQQTAQAQLAAQQKAAFLAAQPQVQSNTSGSLTPQAANAATAGAAGVPIPNDLNTILQQLSSGGGSPSSAPISGGTTVTPGQQNQQQQGQTLDSLSDLIKG